jgi:uncharacterized membrane protein YqjE
MSAASLSILLRTVAAVQLAVALLNLFLVPLLEWKEDLARAPLLLREVFHVHAWFISVTLTIFGLITWQFAGELAAHTNAIGVWLAAGIGIFWAIRTVLQITYYSSRHWRGQFGRTVIHILLFFTYGGMAALYLWAAFGTSP